jgi:hypothetical protein
MISTPIVLLLQTQLFPRAVARFGYLRTFRFAA